MTKVLFILIPFLFLSCGQLEEEEAFTIDADSEVAQHIGDTMASIDEAGGNTTGAITQNQFYMNESLKTTGYEKSFARITHTKSIKADLSSVFLSKANAANCNTVSFSACTSSARTRTFDNCTTAGSGAITGSIDLLFAGSAASSCILPAISDSVTRVPNFTMTNLKGASFVVSAVEVEGQTTGQTLTRTSSDMFSFSNTGIRRKLTNSKGTVLLDVTASSTSPIVFTGTSRTSRTMNSGTLLITDNLSLVTCSFTPTAVSWTAGCNCPTAGIWTGSCSNATTISVAFGSTCGEVAMTVGGTASAVTLDRCQ